MGEPGARTDLNLAAPDARVDGAPPGGAPERGVGWLRLRLVLTLLWAAVAVATLALAPREVPPEDLLRAVEQGRVQEVTLQGGLGADSEGWSSVTATWREGALLRRAAFAEERGAAGSVDLAEGPSGFEVDGGTYVVADVEELLRTTAPDDLALTQRPRQDGLHVLDVPVPGWVGLGFVVLWLTTLALLVQGPRPWRATRWAWFWLSPVPFGALLFVLLSGPLPGRRAGTEPVGPRLTGGWALLLTLLLSSVLPAPFWW